MDICKFSVSFSQKFNSEYPLLFHITRKLSAVSCRAVWRVKEKDKKLAENLCFERTVACEQGEGKEREEEKGACRNGQGFRFPKAGD